MWPSAINMLIVCVLLGMQTVFCAPHLSLCYRILQKLTKIEKDIDKFLLASRTTQEDKEVTGRAGMFLFSVSTSY